MSEVSDEIGTPCERWRGPITLAFGRLFYKDCDECGWPRPDHPEAKDSASREARDA